MPAAKRPEVYGTNKQTLPVSFVGQTLYPFRKPVPALVCTAVAVAFGVFFWQKTRMPLEPQEVAEITHRMDKPPELLRLSQRSKPMAASAIVANAAGSRLIYGASDGSVTIRDVATERELA